MKRNSISVSAGFSVFVFLVFAACTKIETTDIGSDLIPAVDNVSTFDTVMEVITDNLLLPDSTRILRTENHALGIIENDAEFGRTQAEIDFSLTPATYGRHPFLKKDSTLIVDSVVLVLAYQGMYGDSNAIQKINVHEIASDAIFGNKVIGYRIDTADIPYELDVLGTKVVDFKTLDDSVFDIQKRDTLRLKNQLRIKLDNSLATRFLAYDTSNAYNSDSAFKAAFKGLSIKIDAGGSTAKTALAYFSPSNVNTKLLFYYRVTSGSVITDTLITEFAFYSTNYSNANLIRRTPGNNYNTYLTNGNGNDDKVYLQSSPGSYATIKIPGLSAMSNRIIHRAELIVETLPSLESEKYETPGLLFLDAIDSARKLIITVPYDFTYENNFQFLFGGLAKNGKYTFNLSRYLQSIITRHEPDYTLRISAPFRTNAAEIRGSEILIPSPTGATGIPINQPIAYGRIVVAGGSNPDTDKKMRLRIIYSKI